MELALLILIFLMTLVVHEVSHGLVAYFFGDPTAKLAGRLSLNPLKHLDPFWTVLFPALLFISTGGRFAIGMAKPVPVDFSRLRDPKRNMIWVAFAGPLANLLFAAALGFLYKGTGYLFLLYAVYFNLGLAFFNLIPIPPMDGSRILAGMLPLSSALKYLRIEPYGFLIILVLYFSGLLFTLIVPPMNFFCALLGVPRLMIGY